MSDINKKNEIYQANETFDAFICHASEDKQAVVRPLAQALVNNGLKIWYDEFSLKLGDSLRQSIEHGLAQSRFGIVIISPHFFDKKWAQAELNGLFAKEMVGEKTIIPVWHNIEQKDIMKKSPIIADKFAAKMTDGMDRVLEQILDVIEQRLLHKSKDNLVATIEPKNFRLQSGDWSIKTFVLISNHSNKNLYALSIKLTIEDRYLKAEDIEVDVSEEKDTFKLSSPELPIISGHAITFRCVDSDGCESILVIISRIGAKKDRNITFSGRKPLKEHEESLASVKICDFSTEPVELFMESEGKVAIKFQPPENITVKSAIIKMRKRN